MHEYRLTVAIHKCIDIEDSPGLNFVASFWRVGYRRKSPKLVCQCDNDGDAASLPPSGHHRYSNLDFAKMGPDALR